MVAAIVVKGVGNGKHTHVTEEWLAIGKGVAFVDDHIDTAAVDAVDAVAAAAVVVVADYIVVTVARSLTAAH